MGNKKKADKFEFSIGDDLNNTQKVRKYKTKRRKFIY